jgi:hypothetical protein
VSNETFTCENCGGTWEKAWTDDEARAEASVDFADELASGQPMCTVCDDCYRAMMGDEAFRAEVDELYGRNL